MIRRTKAEFPTNLSKNSSTLKIYPWDVTKIFYLITRKETEIHSQPISVRDGAGTQTQP